jgi:hypothetical protein
MTDCSNCLVNATLINIAAEVTPLYVGSPETYGKTRYHEGSYQDVPVRAYFPATGLMLSGNLTAAASISMIIGRKYSCGLLRPPDVSEKRSTLRGSLDLPALRSSRVSSQRYSSR